MTLFLVQTAMLLAAGAVLWRLWRMTGRDSARIGMLVAGAVLLRAVPGVLLFWISYLELPFARSLQLAKGFWFYATDGLAYFNRALAAASDGLPGIVLMTDHNPSVVYNKVLALFLWALGPIPAVGVLLNLFTFLGIAALVVIWARRHDIGFFGTAVPIVAAGYSPSWVLWSTQPLKDAFFCFAIVLLAFAVDHWVAVWREDAPRPRRILGAALLLAVAVYGVAGVRWYYALLALGAALLPFASAVFRAGLTPRRRTLAALAAVAMLFVLAQQIVFASGPYLPDSIRDLLQLRVKSAAESMPATIEGSRRSFDSYVDAGTRIRVGENLARAEEPRPAVLVAAKPATPPPPVRVTPAVPPPEPKPEVPAAPDTAATTTVATDTAATATVAPAVATTTVATDTVATATVATTTVATDTAATATVAPATVATATVATTTVATDTAATATAAPAPAPVPAPAAAVEAEPREIVADPVADEGPAAQPDVPRTWKTRLIAGAVALLLPHFVGEGLGLISLGGGRGFWWFADADTLLFNVFVVAALAGLFVRPRAWRDPFVWYLLAVSVAIAGALAYTVSNYGALFRHRSMVLAVLVLLPLAVYRSRRQVVADRDADDKVAGRDRGGVSLASSAEG